MDRFGRVFAAIHAVFRTQPINFGVAGLLAVLILNSMIAYRAADNIGESSMGVVRTMQGTYHLETVIAALNEAESGQRGYLLTGDGRYLDTYNVAEYNVREQIGALTQYLSEVPTQRQKLALFLQMIDDRLRELTSAITLRENQDIEGARKLVLDNDGKGTMTKIKFIALDVESEQTRLLMMEARLRDRNQNNLTRTFWLSTAINVVLVLWISKLVRKILSALARERWREHRHALEANSRKEALEREVERRREAEAAVQALNAKLEVRVEERTRELTEAYRQAEGFNYSISHDLRAPLRAIVSSSRILLEEHGTVLNPDAKHELQRQAAAANRLGILIDDLLHLSRLSRQEMVAETVDLTELAQSVARELNDREWPVRPLFDIQPGLMASGDPALLRLLLTRLMENAVKFSPRGAYVTIGRQETIHGKAFFVQDHGIGIEPQFAHRIFLPFERLVSDAEYEGTGIGLANAKRIVERHGGQLWVESEPGEGATFFFTLGSKVPSMPAGKPSESTKADIL